MKVKVLIFVLPLVLLFFLIPQVTLAQFQDDVCFEVIQQLGCLPDQDRWGTVLCEERPEECPQFGLEETKECCYCYPQVGGYACDLKAAYDPNKLPPLKLKLNVSIPGLGEFSTGEGVEITNETLAKYIGGLYKFFIGIAGILAVFMIMFGGLQWLFSGGNAQKVSSAKETIFGAAIGLILAIGSFTILQIINPRLVSFGKLGVSLVPIITGEPGKELAACISDNFVKPIPNIPNVQVTASDPRLTPETIDKLKLAAASFYGTPTTLVITSAYRTSAFQKRLYDCYMSKKQSGVCPPSCGGNCNEAAAPACQAPHQTGEAVDVCIRNGPNNIDTCNYINARYNGGGNGEERFKLGAAQDYLQTIMAEAGFSRYCGEWWHFESIARSTPCAPGDYQ
ncbi:D-alanyl-D-alanine carboxypeptidase family protein [Patescibacteria group bacterium]|nr:D-alanyl-D-alanine carboxypeptidase family protein [Patescibacteria group bacterium]